MWEVFQIITLMKKGCLNNEPGSCNKYGKPHVPSFFVCPNIYFFFSPYVVDCELQVYYFHSFLQDFQCCSVQYQREIFVGNRTLG